LPSGMRWAIPKSDHFPHQFPFVTSILSKWKMENEKRHARVHFAINPDAAKLKCVNTDFLHRLFHSCGGRSVPLDGRKTKC